MTRIAARTGRTRAVALVLVAAGGLHCGAAADTDAAEGDGAPVDAATASEPPGASSVCNGPDAGHDANGLDGEDASPASGEDAPYSSDGGPESGTEPGGTGEDDGLDGGTASASGEAGAAAPSASCVDGKAACAVEGNWIWTITRLETQGCLLNNCGHGPYEACGTTTLATATLPAAGQIEWAQYIPGVLGNFAGTLTPEQTLETTNTFFPTSTLTGRFDEACHFEGEIRYVVNDCDATITLFSDDYRGLK